MDGLSPSVWFPVVTLIAGLVLKGVFDFLGDSRKNKAERQARIEKRREVFLMQRVEAQRKLLPELQEALSELMRCTSLINLSDLESSRNGFEWGKEHLSEDLSERSRSAFMQVTLFRVRVQDEQLRTAIADLSLTCTGVTSAKTQFESNAALDEASFKYESANELIGQVLRDLDSSENAIFEKS